MPLAFMQNGMSNRRIAGLLFLEAAVIFAGITGSFWMEEWRQQREDQRTYRHLLEEIYYNTAIAEAELPISIAANNLALKDALELTVLGSSQLEDTELYDRLGHIFDGVGAAFRTAGYVRLSNTSLAIPFDETLLILDNTYEDFAGLERGLMSLNTEIAELRGRHWRSAGMISCTGAASNDGTVILMERPYMTEIRSLMYPDDNCITEAENAARARELLGQAGVAPGAVFGATKRLTGGNRSPSSRDQPSGRLHGADQLAATDDGGHGETDSDAEDGNAHLGGNRRPSRGLHQV